MSEYDGNINDKNGNINSDENFSAAYGNFEPC